MCILCVWGLGLGLGLGGGLSLGWLGIGIPVMRLCFLPSVFSWCRYHTRDVGIRLAVHAKSLTDLPIYSTIPPLPTYPTLTNILPLSPTSPIKTHPSTQPISCMTLINSLLARLKPPCSRAIHGSFVVPLPRALYIYIYIVCTTVTTSLIHFPFDCSTW